MKQPLLKSIFNLVLGLKYHTIVFTIFTFVNSATSQTIIYSTNFGTNVNVNPPGWTFSGVNMNISNNTSSSGYSGVSGGAYLGEGNSVAFINTSGISEPSSQIGTSEAILLISTMSYSAVAISFGMRKSSSGYNSNATYALEWSIDGISYNTISYTEAAAGTWGLASGAGLTLPAGAGNQPTLYLRWSFVRTGTASNFKIDDVIITGINLVTNTAPSIIMDVTNTTNYLDGGVTISPTTPYSVSGVINDPTDPAANLGFDFTINDAQTIASNLTVTAISNNVSVVPNSNIILTGNSASRNVKITPISVGYASVTISVTDGTYNSQYILNYASSAASSTPSNTLWHTGISDASVAIPIDDNYYITGDDELDVLNVYSRSSSGLPLVSFDYTSLLGLDLSKPEVDVEASASSPLMVNRKYWLGSMSTGGSAFVVRPNRDRLFATTISGTGAATTFSLNGYYANLRAMLISWGDVNGYDFSTSAAAGVDSKSISGFAAEGMVFSPDNTTLFIGLRAPLVPIINRTKAVIAPIINFESWFNNGTPSGNPTFGSPIELDLGGRGFRDLIRLSNGTYIIIAGNPAGSPITSAIYKWTGNASDAPILVITSANSVLNMEGVLEVNVSGLVSLNQLQVISDGGTDDLYNDGFAAKDLADLNLRKFRFDNLKSINLCLPTTPSITASNNTICFGQTTNLMASGANTYTWSGGANGNSYSVSPTTNTTYSVMGSDVYGCGGSALITITVNPTPTISISSSNSLICNGQSVILSANANATSYLWSNGSSTSTISITPSITAIYSITVSNGLCSSNSSITQSVSACTELEETNDINSINIYPNPFNNSFNIKCDANYSIGSEIQISVYNTLGEILLTTKTSGNSLDINSTDWDNGTYFIRLNNKVYKIIKLQ